MPYLARGRDDGAVDLQERGRSIPSRNASRTALSSTSRLACSPTCCPSMVRVTFPRSVSDGKLRPDVQAARTGRCGSVRSRSPLTRGTDGSAVAGRIHAPVRSRVRERAASTSSGRPLNSSRRGSLGRRTGSSSKPVAPELIPTRLVCPPERPGVRRKRMGIPIGPGLRGHSRAPAASSVIPSRRV